MGQENLNSFTPKNFANFKITWVKPPKNDLSICLAIQSLFSFGKIIDLKLKKLYNIIS